MPAKSIVPSILAAGAALVLGASAHAAIGGAGSTAVRSAPIAPVENVQFIFGGRNYCWYNHGWRGAGWYWCGSNWRRGIGWGGPWGWRGWGVRPPRNRMAGTPVVRPRPGIQRNVRPNPGAQGNMRPSRRPGNMTQRGPSTGGPGGPMSQRQP